MSGSFWLSLFDPTTGMFMLPGWAAAAFAAVLVLAVMLAMLRGGAAIVAGGLVGLVLLALATIFASLESNRVAQVERAQEQQALLSHAQNLAAQATAPGSVLGCLDGAVGETVEAACERALFAGPEAIAAAAAYTAARLALLEKAAEYAARAKANSEAAVPGLRVALETDPFGFVAQVLASRHGCSVEKCPAFALFRDPSRIAGNLKEHTYEAYVTRHAGSWQVRNHRTPTASSGSSPVPPGFNVPSAASIPPVSIMVPEPTTPNNGAASSEAAAAPPRRPSPPRSTRPTAPAPPVQLVPPAPTAPPQATGSIPRLQ